MTVLAVLHPDGPRLVDPATPLVRADDEGLLRGESVFETLRVAEGGAAFVGAHLRRLHRSAERLALDLPEGWEQLTELALSRWTPPEGVLRWVLTRGGVAYALVSPVPAESLRQRAQGVRVVTLDAGVPAGLRAGAAWLLGGVKTTSYAVNMAALREARSRGADDAVLLSSDGQVLEGPTSNVAWVRDGILITPPDDTGVLPGITMQVVRGLCREHGIPVQVRRGAARELAAADEILLTGSIKGVAPVVALDGRPMATGPVSARLRESFEARVSTDAAAHRGRRP
ncbi:MAG: Branched-chain amino acid aminotransferase/4-amino-4-deoxychorismate lyase [Frankiales bacterium]|nr:Branched-chain amino acid aminotransferase/4-amino-4-deoxychorismate lyase [Frankiales bacterium]